jgi:hypothetical protein
MKGAEANSPSPVSLSLWNGPSQQIVTDPDSQEEISHPACEIDTAKDVCKRLRFRLSCPLWPSQSLICGPETGPEGPLYFLIAVGWGGAV